MNKYIYKINNKEYVVEIGKIIDEKTVEINFLARVGSLLNGKTSRGRFPSSRKVYKKDLKPLGHV